MNLRKYLINLEIISDPGVVLTDEYLQIVVVLVEFLYFGMSGERERYKAIVELINMTNPWHFGRILLVFVSCYGLKIY